MYSPGALDRLPSLLNRLADDDPTQAWDTFRPNDLGDQLQVFEKELNALLNTAAFLSPADAPGPLSRDSAPFCGMPDLAAINPRSAEQMEVVRASLQRFLTRFEPRLRDVRVSPSGATGGGHACRFLVTANLRLDRDSVSVSLTTDFDAAARRMTVSAVRPDDA